MKTLISTIIAILFAAFAAHATINSDSVVGAWLFDEGEGSRTDERTKKYKYHMWLRKIGVHITPGATWVDGKFGHALDLTRGSGSWTGGAKYLPTEEITLTIWVKSEYKGIARVFGTGWWDVDKRDWRIAAYLPFEDRMSWRFGSPYKELSVALPDGINRNVEWRHWAFVHSKRDNWMAIYLDGEKLASQNDSTTYILHGDPNWSLGSLVTHRLKGVVDDFGIFNRRLTQAEIQFIIHHGLETSLAVAPKHNLAVSWGAIKR